jgi:ABC-type multidrug transport system fused ATPase/permease subunit
MRVLELTSSSIVAVFFLSILNAVSEGVGVAFLIPILKFMELGADGFAHSDSQFLKILVSSLKFVNLPLTFSVILTVCFVPIIVKQIFFYIYYSYIAQLKNTIISRLQSTIFSRTILADLAYVEKEGQAKFLSALTLESERAGNAVFLLFQLSWALMLIATYFLVLLFLSWKLTLIAAAVLLSVEFIIHKQMKVMSVFGNRISELNQDLTKFLQERTSGIRLVKLAHAETHEADSLRQIASAIALQRTKIQSSIALVQSFIEPALAVGGFIILFIAFTYLKMSISFYPTQDVADHENGKWLSAGDPELHTGFQNPRASSLCRSV